MSMGQQPRKHSETNNALADEIRAERRAQEMSQDELGKRVGLSRVQIVRIENKDRVIDVSQAEGFAKALGLSVLELFMRAERRMKGAGADSQASGQ